MTHKNRGKPREILMLVDADEQNIEISPPDGCCHIVGGICLEMAVKMVPDESVCCQCDKAEGQSAPASCPATSENLREEHNLGSRKDRSLMPISDAVQEAVNFYIDKTDEIAFNQDDGLVRDIDVAYCHGYYCSLGRRVSGGVGGALQAYHESEEFADLTGETPEDFSKGLDTLLEEIERNSGDDAQDLAN